MRSLWTVWGKVLACFLLVAMLVFGVMVWAVLHATGSTFPDIGEYTVTQKICITYIQQVYNLKGHLESASDTAFGHRTVIKPDSKQVLKAIFYSAGHLQEPHPFECTVRSAGTEYGVTAFHWR